jgi:hypothetical protein
VIDLALAGQSAKRGGKREEAEMRGYALAVLVGSALCACVTPQADLGGPGGSTSAEGGSGSGSGGSSGSGSGGHASSGGGSTSGSGGSSGGSTSSSGSGSSSGGSSSGAPDDGGLDSGCGTATNLSCSSCGFVLPPICVDGGWTCPDTTNPTCQSDAGFACGGLACDSQTQYCHVLQAGGTTADGGGAAVSYQCVSLGMCNQACGCLVTMTANVGCMCTETGYDVTVTCKAP